MKETLLYSGTMTWWIFFAAFIGANGLAIWVSPIAWLILLLPALDRIFIRYSITDQAVSARHGIIFRKTETVSIKNIEGIDVQQSILGMMLKYGTVTVRGTGGDAVVLYLTPRPLWLQATIQRQISA